MIIRQGRLKNGDNGTLHFEVVDIDRETESPARRCDDDHPMASRADGVWSSKDPSIAQCCEALDARAVDLQ